MGGETVRAFTAGDSGPGVVVFHPWWGLNGDVTAYADRLAAAGFRVLAPDLVRGRVANTIADAESLSSSVDAGHADAVALAAIDRLASSASRVATLGFSMGAPWALWSTALRPATGACVVYYGTGVGPATLAKGLAPVLGHFAESDPYEPDEAVAALEKGLHEAGRAATIHRYAGTGHWFAEPSQPAYRREAADLAFERTVAFLEASLFQRSGRSQTQR